MKDRIYLKIKKNKEKKKKQEQQVSKSFVIPMEKSSKKEGNKKVLFKEYMKSVECLI